MARHHWRALSSLPAGKPGHPAAGVCCRVQRPSAPATPRPVRLLRSHHRVIQSHLTQPRGQTCAPTCRATASTAGASWPSSGQHPRSLAGRSRRVSAGLQLNRRAHADRTGVPVRNVERDTMVSMFVSSLVCPCWPLPWADGGDHASHSTAQVALVRECRPATRTPTARPSTSATRRRSGSPTWAGPTTASLSPSTRRRSRLLGLRGDTAGSRSQGPRGPSDHPPAGADVLDGPASRGSTHSG